MKKCDEYFRCWQIWVFDFGNVYLCLFQKSLDDFVYMFIFKYLLYFNIKFKSIDIWDLYYN